MTYLSITIRLLSVTGIGKQAMSLKAVIFDVGGVVCKSPLIAIAAYEQENSIPNNYINCLIARIGPNGAWQQFERGEISLWDFYPAFSRELSDTVRGNAWYRDYCKRNGIECPPLPDKLNIDGREIFGRMMNQARQWDPIVIRAIQHIRASGKYRIIALTNSFSAADPDKLPPPPSDFTKVHKDFVSVEAEKKYLGWGEGVVPLPTKSLFDDFCDSSVLGMRKPEPEFYLAACRRNGIKPTECVFLDDLRMNLKTAKALGMKTIHVPIGRSLHAIRQLEEILEMNLTSDAHSGHSGAAKL